MSELYNYDIKNYVKKEFQETFSEIIEQGVLNKEIVNKMFIALLQQSDIISLIKEDLESNYRSNEVYRGIYLNNFKSEKYYGCSLEDEANRMNEFVEISIHSIHTGFEIYLLREYEPRDCTYYTAIVFNVS